MRNYMGKHVLQVPSADGFIYIYDADRKTLQKIHDIDKLGDIPEDVMETLNAANLRVETGKE
jgi:hypothetical protein